jgi:hypothetical protein
MATLTCNRRQPSHTSPDHPDRWQDLVMAARLHPVGSRERNRYLTQLIRELSPLLWRTHTPEYADAQQQVWRFFIERGIAAYNPDCGSMVSWLNTHLWYRHQDLLRQAAQRQRYEQPIAPATRLDETWPTTVREVPAPEYGSLEMLDQVRQWVTIDVKKYLGQIYLRDRPDVNAQVLILLRLPAETPWKQISAQFEVSVPTLNSFYQRKCLPLLRQFGQAQGFL